MIFDTVTIVICAVLVVLALLSSFLDTFFRKVRAGGNGPSGPATPCRPVSVIVVADNNAEDLRANLDSLLSQDYEPGYEVIVVVDKDEDGTGDFLKAYGKRPNLYTTFVPDSSRYMSRRKLAITLGVKAAKNELILLTDATCRPVSDKWISVMASRLDEGTDIVMGYSNYIHEAGLFKVFYRFHCEYSNFREACNGAAYGMAGNNIMFRKDVFMAGNGFQGNLKYLRGEYGFLVNKYAGHGNAAVETSCEGRVEDRVPTRKEWHSVNLFYRETRRHLDRSFSHRLAFNLDMLSLYAGLVAGAGSAVYAVLTQMWLMLPFSSVALFLPVVVRLLNARRAMRLFGESVPLWKVFPFELRLVWHNLRYAISYRFTDKYEFTSHKS
ncbi:glycosyltransferase group 2 family protein [Prevotella sp. CAG:1058]|nr:glycosyltransferase group 2 family protein [Prevotella sp. CAG:1058]